MKLYLLKDGIAISCDILDREFLDVNNIPNIKKNVSVVIDNSLKFFDAFIIPRSNVYDFLCTLGSDVTITY